MAVKWRSMLVGGAISAGCLFVLARKIDLAKTGEALARADPTWLVVALALIAASVVVRCWRWQLLFLPDHRVSLWSTISSTLIGYMFNTVLPGRVGELARASLVSQTGTVGTARALGTILVEKILDVLVLLLGLGALTAVIPLPAWATTAGVSASIVFGTVAAAFFVLSNFRGPVVAWAARYVDRLPLAGRLHPSSVADMLLGAADGLRRPRLLILQLVVSPALWLLALFTVVAVMRAFQLEAPWTAGALMLVMTNLGMTVPSAPGYVGVYHAIAVLSLSFFGVDPAVALSCAVALHALGFGSFTIIGALLLVTGLLQQAYTVSDIWRWRAPALSRQS